MGGAENALMLKILVCWLDMGSGSCNFFFFFFLEQALHLKLLVLLLLQPGSIPLKAQPVRPQVCAFVLASGVFTTSP